MKWLLEAVTDVQEQHDGRLLVTIGNETETFDRPNDKDVNRQMVVDIRRVLKATHFRRYQDDGKA